MKGFCLEVAGDFACFTRPEMKVERVSYDVITPSAARAIFDAILWKPAIVWRISRIDIMNPIRWTSVRRNEVSAVATPKSSGILIEDTRAQRAALVLSDVKYRPYAYFDFIPQSQRQQVRNHMPSWFSDEEDKAMQKHDGDRQDENEAKYAAMFERRASKGQCFTQPYLGCREFACRYFKLLKQAELDVDQPIEDTRDLGFMLYDMDYSNAKNISPMFFHAKVINGVIQVPQHDSQEVLK